MTAGIVDRPEAGGSLRGLRIIEFAGLGPAPFCGMMLADHGADVIRIDRVNPRTPFGDPTRDVLNRSRPTIHVDLGQPEGADIARQLCCTSDGLIEGFRPGVMERLGLGPDVIMQDNPKLVYGRMTGWGQLGPYAAMAGHDVNYIAVSGALHACGRAGQPPIVPLNLVGDFGGGGMMLAFGMLAGLISARVTGLGQVVDCSMSDGAALLMSQIYSFHGQGLWTNERGQNPLDTGAPFYDVYETSDGKFVAIGSIEPQFYGQLIELLHLGDQLPLERQYDRAGWPAMRGLLQQAFATRTRNEWCALFEGTDICFAPVMSLNEAPSHTHNLARHTFLEVDGMIQPAPAPRFSGTPAPEPRSATGLNGSTHSVLADLGYSASEIQRLFELKVVSDGTSA